MAGQDQGRLAPVEDGQVHWFGRSWGAPINEQPEDPIPVGRNCVDCEQPILYGDSGVTMMMLLTYDEESQLGQFVRVPSHLSCHMDAVLGPGWWAKLKDRL